MKKITFSHKYFKLSKSETEKVRLLQVLKINRSELSKEMIEYDTAYSNGHYELPNGDLILLIFSTLSYTSSIFTTIRRYTTEKWLYYKDLEGEIFKIIVCET